MATSYQGLVMQEIVYLEPNKDELEHYFKLSFILFGVTIIVTSMFVFLQVLGYQAILSLILGYFVGYVNMKLLVITMTAVLDQYTKNPKKRIYLSVILRYGLYFFALLASYLSGHLNMVFVVIGIMLIKGSFFVSEIVYRG